MISRLRQLDLPDVVVVEFECFPDARGFFMEMYKRSDFSRAGISESFVQDNYSHSSRKALRGLHYQKAPGTQAKLVSVLHGEIFDVAVDLRRESPSYGRWTSVVLSSNKPEIVYVPVGFAHGFCVLSDGADVLYKVSAEYAPELSRGIIWNDPDVAVGWPLSAPVISCEDARLPRLRDAENDFLYEANR